MSCGFSYIKTPLLSGIIIASGGVNLGLGLAYCSPTLNKISEEFNFTIFESNMFNVLGFLSALLGCIIVTFFMKKFGKRLTSFFCAIFTFLSWIGLGFSQTKIIIFLFRFLTGVSVGLFSTLSPVFIVEIAPPNKRGQFGFLNQLGISIGYLTITGLGMFLNWRYLAFACSTPILLLIFFGLLIPEPISSALKASFSRIFKFPKELIISITLMFFLQFSGINAVLSNLENIINQAKLTISTHFVALLANISQMIATLLASIIVDKWGQRLCWSLSSIGQLIAFILLGSHQIFKLNSIFFVIGLFLEQLSFGIGTGPIPFTRAAELFRIEIRSSAMSLVTAIQWLLASSVVFIWPIMKDFLNLGGSFYFFAFIAFLSLIFGLFMLNPLSENDDESSDNEETENISRRLSHARDLPEL